MPLDPSSHHRPDASTVRPDARRPPIEQLSRATARGLLLGLSTALSAVALAFFVVEFVSQLGSWAFGATSDTMRGWHHQLR